MANSIREVQTRVARTARYFLVGEVGTHLEHVWFVCHGYGQLGSYFLKHFSVLDDGSRLIVAPEGLSRFYLEGFDGRIGASWMTREDRLHEIEDYGNYLDVVYREIFEKVNREAVKVSVLGFSQGTATVCRWLNRGRVEADRLILWAGLMPPELDLSEPSNVFRKLGVSFVVGKRDSYAKPTVLAEQEKRLKENDIPFRSFPFEGGHEIDGEMLKQVANVLT